MLKRVKFKYVALIALFWLGESIAAPYVQDSGRIVNLYVNASGSLAVQLDNGFPNASADGQCPTATINGFGGNEAADAAFKSALLAANSAQQKITVTVQGCEASGAWFKIIDVYVN